MDTLEQLLQQLEQIIATAKKSVFSANDAIVNRGQVLDMIDRIRSAYPDVVRDAQAIVKDCENQKQQTISYCANMIQEAEQRRGKILDESEILKQADEEASGIRKESMELRARVEYEVKCKVDDVLRDSEVTLRDALTLIRNNREELRGSINGAQQPAGQNTDANANPNT